MGSTSPAELQYLSLFKFIGDNLRNRPYQWPQLKRGYTFTVTEDTTRYQLPGDFYRILDSSQWDTTNMWPLRGPISDFQWTVRNFAVVSLQTRKAFRILGPTNYLYNTSPYSQRSRGWFEIDPAPDNSSDELYLGYLSCNWIQPRDWVTSTAYTAGNIRSGNGYVYIARNNATSGATRPNWTTGSAYDGGGVSGVQWTVYSEPYEVNSSNTNLNDSDLCLFDDDLMIEGMRWAYYRAKKQEYEQERADWEQQVKSAFARFNGPCRVSMSEDNDYLDGWPNIPAGSWNV